MYSPLKEFIQHTTRLMDQPGSDQEMAMAVKPALAKLISTDDWLPEAFTKPHETFYQQYLLHCDPLERFSVVSFVWGPGQQTPVHDHTVWGLIGMLRGAEVSTPYAVGADGRFGPAEPVTLQPGDIDILLPEQGDIHHVRNAHDDQVSISIHVYGANIGAVRRHVFDRESGATKEFVSGFSAPVVPNVWS